ncbi:DUF6397 family protein [Streptomyces murinus]|uniref:Uncharacterized protein n=1 Tax=Streptomyces murinus TaxID=33900 RepID=A0A7W3NK94_STRMR|nr:hypothetical protein [Streptomyces murinus]
MSAHTFEPVRSDTCTPSRAARELSFLRGEFDLAVQLGHVRTVPDEGGGGGRLVERAEIDRLRAQDGFPDTLRDRVRVVGTTDGAELMDISAGRFTRLARLGLLVPAKVYVNRYGAVVWLYLTEELKHFAAVTENTHLLKGRTPETLRGQLAEGVDLRARNWRMRQLGCLLRQAEDPWARAGALAALLPPVEVADVVEDPYERAWVNRLRPALPGQTLAGTSFAHIAERITTAQDADEIEWLRSDLAHSVEEARALSPAPRPAVRRTRPTTRPTARPIPPLAHTVTAPVEPVPTPVEPTETTAESRAATAEPMAEAAEPTSGTVKLRRISGGHAPKPRHAPERRHVPRVRPAPSPVLRPPGSGHTPPRSTRPLRAWLRRGTARPAAEVRDPAVAPGRQPATGT